MKKKKYKLLYERNKIKSKIRNISRWIFSTMKGFFFSVKLLGNGSKISMRVFFFFFQAEDGIRCRNVTGVQTCALPISRRARPGCDPSPGGFALTSRSR